MAKKAGRLRSIFEMRPIPYKWRIPTAILAGIFFGLSILGFKFSGGFSNLSKSSKACINCHVMDAQYLSWSRESHMASAECIDCHLPHDTFLRYWMVKAESGMKDLWVFTTRTEPQCIRIRDKTNDIIQQNCVRCHSDIVDTLTIFEASHEDMKHGGSMLCWQCHREAGHGRMSSLTLTPHAIVPGQTARVPEWLDNLINREQSKTGKDIEGRR